ncbi:MAG: SiaB family protein kinase [Bacteroidia bacterium]|jgi:hypothetical protein|nr:SiaB family protein kinase [Bacteroidia bacterium]
MNLEQYIKTSSSTTDLGGLHSFYRQMIDNNLLMIYEGEFSQEITRSVLNLTEKSFEMNNLDPGLRKKVVNVMIESLQNICKHQYTVSEAGKDGFIPAVFMIGKRNGNYVIITGNMVHKQAESILTAKIDKINSFDKEGLKQYYKESRLAAKLSDVGGAGLGLIDMARKSGNSLIYRFDEAEDQTLFYTLLVEISAQKDEE